jgi:hypothetical protein
MATIKQDQYLDDVMNYLEYIGLPNYVAEYAPEDVARSFSGAIEAGYEFKLSIRLAALMIFGMTMEKIVNMNAKMVKH